MGVSTWLRRVFGQQRDLQGATPVRGADLGFGGAAADVVVTDGWQRERLEQAVTPDQRWIAAVGYARKVLKNARLAGESRGDLEVLDLLDRMRAELADATLAATERLKVELAERGMDDDPALWPRRSSAA
jgi:hypothetical protein